LYRRVILSFTITNPSFFMVVCALLVFFRYHILKVPSNKVRPEVRIEVYTSASH